MNMTIVYPAVAHTAYRIAAQAFAALAEQTADAKARLVDDENFDASDAHDAVVLIGNDAVNRVTASLYLEQKTESFGIRYGTDDYAIRTLEEGGVPYLLLAGGRPRATIYAVYRYFDLFCGCRWFWDGDRIPKTALRLFDIDLCESPRFAYRGLRYFAHRSLHRFQAEHWSLADWQTEIDWILKKRLNLFMLRIGMDDLFQKAFPDEVSYPPYDEPLPEAGQGYDDRTLFWSLEYRGELRRQVLEYAFARDLMHPEDCGTMSHWYSRTPMEFLEKRKPRLLPQATTTYSEPTGRVWDIREKGVMDDYFRLTETHIREYGSPEIFHTIGLGERKFSADREVNRRMKLYVYRQIATQVKERYPNAPLLIASWDLWMRFTPEEVRSLVSELDPTQSILFDYTSDTTRKNNFTEWGVIGKFPWVFGIFGGYEPNTEVRGYYDLTQERLRIAKDDPMCRGLVLWSEFSHGDPFAIEYFAHNAWEGQTLTLTEQVARYCRDRYPASMAEEMTAIWQDFMPIVSLRAWSQDDTTHQVGNDLFAVIEKRAEFSHKRAEEYRTEAKTVWAAQAAAASVLQRLSRLPMTDSLVRRDFCDIARTVIGRMVNGAIVLSELRFAEGAPRDDLEEAMATAEKLLAALSDLLGSHEDYSLLSSLKRLEAVTKTNPSFEHTLKNNASCEYCRAYIYENAAYLYLPEMRVLWEAVRMAADKKAAVDTAALASRFAAIREDYMRTPLSEMKRTTRSLDEIVREAADVIASFAADVV